MKNKAFLMAAATVIAIFAGFGCIPSAPPQAEQQAAPVAPSAPPPAAPPAPVAAPVTAPPSAPAAPVAPGPNTANLNVPLNENVMQQGAVALPVIALKPLESIKGYAIQSKFPVEGLSMEGTLIMGDEGVWKLSGHFVSDTEAFKPGPPQYQSMGSLVPKEGGGLQVTDNTAEVIITFAAPLPPANAPKAAAPLTLPFELEIKAPVNTFFNIMLTPF